MMLKDSNLNLPEGQPVEATLKVGDEPFSAFSAHVLGHDEISIFSQHGAALTAAPERGARATFKATSEQLEFPLQFRTTLC